jgi:hypothetical protein
VNVHVAIYRDVEHEDLTPTDSAGRGQRKRQAAERLNF